MIAVIGGTGELGQGLVARWALAGQEVVIGSRSLDKAKKVARDVSKKLKLKRPVEAATNLDAAKKADIIVLSVPFESIGWILSEIKPVMTTEKILLSMVVPLKFDSEGIVYSPPPSGSAAEEVARMVSRSKVVSAFYTIRAKQLHDVDSPISCDVVICGDDNDAKKKVTGLVRAISGVRPIDGGPLRNSRLVESMIALLLELTRKYKVSGVRVKFEGI